MAEARADKADARAQAKDPLPPGADALAALDPATRELVTSLEPAADPEAQEATTVGDRIGAALMGAGIGGFTGAMIANWTPRYQRIAGAGPINVPATVAFAGIGAAIGAVAGFAKGHDPLQGDPKEAVGQHLPEQHTTLGAAPIPTHPAFASLSAR